MKKIFMICLLGILVISCKGVSMAGENFKWQSLQDVSQATWDNLAQKKIYFGHQSVGVNIINGMQDVLSKNSNIKLDIMATDAPKYDKAAFAHSKVGRNTKPNSKCDAFQDIVIKGVGDKADIALMKFCYIDISNKSDVQAIFDYYKKMIAKLQAKYPKLRIVHVTVPLMTAPRGIKSRIKQFLKLSSPGVESNIKRNEFNNLMLREYKGKQPVFDLARLESTHPDGRRELFRKGAVEYYTLVRGYTNDGGHLNEKGRKIIAEQLLIFLSKIG